MANKSLALVLSLAVCGLNLNASNVVDIKEETKEVEVAQYVAKNAKEIAILAEYAAELKKNGVSDEEVLEKLEAFAGSESRLTPNQKLALAVVAGVVGGAAVAAGVTLYLKKDAMANKDLDAVKLNEIIAKLSTEKVKEGDVEVEKAKEKIAYNDLIKALHELDKKADKKADKKDDKKADEKADEKGDK